MNDTKHFILKTAFKLFLQKGYSAVSMNELVRETQLTKGAFYHYFASKEDLYQETVKEFFFKYLQEYLSNIPQDETLHNALYRFFDFYYCTHSELCKITGEEGPNLNFHVFLVDGANRDSSVKKQMASLFRGYRKYFEHVVTNAISNGEIRPNIDPVFLARHILSLFDGLFLLSSFFSSETESMEQPHGSLPMDKLFKNVIDQLYSFLVPHDSAITTP